MLWWTRDFRGPSIGPHDAERSWSLASTTDARGVDALYAVVYVRWLAAIFHICLWEAHIFRYNGSELEGPPETPRCHISVMFWTFYERSMMPRGRFAGGEMEIFVEIVDEVRWSGCVIHPHFRARPRPINRYKLHCNTFVIMHRCSWKTSMVNISILVNFLWLSKSMPNFLLYVNVYWMLILVPISNSDILAKMVHPSSRRNLQ